MNISDQLASIPLFGQLYLTTLVFFGGLCWGSFLNVCIHRIPIRLSIVMPPSHCPRCQKYIAWYDNIPLISYINLGGKCRHCHASISPRYFLIELLTGILFILVWLKFMHIPGVPGLGLAPVNSLWIVPVYWVVVAGLITGTFIDFEHMIIPDRVTIGGMIAGLVFSALVPDLHFQNLQPHTARWFNGALQSLTGMAIGFGILYGVAIVGRLAFKREAMGFGDVKLMGAIGAFLGWKAVLFTLIVSSFAGSAVGITLILLKRRQLQSKIPYGPYLALAALLWMLWGPSWWQAYVNYLAFST